MKRSGRVSTQVRAPYWPPASSSATAARITSRRRSRCSRFRASITDSSMATMSFMSTAPRPQTCAVDQLGAERIVGPGLGVDRHHVQVRQQDQRRLGIRDGGRQSREARAATGCHLQHLCRDAGLGQHLGAEGSRPRLAARRVQAGSGVAHARRVDRRNADQVAQQLHALIGGAIPVGHRLAVTDAGEPDVSRPVDVTWPACSACRRLASSASGSSASSRTTATTSSTGRSSARPITSSAARK